MVEEVPHREEVAAAGGVLKRLQELFVGAGVAVIAPARAGRHAHARRKTRARCAGSDTKRTGFYPPMFCDLVHNAFAENHQGKTETAAVASAILAQAGP